ncbi:hypothetical protein HYALB_00002140 [Hymenoscyphus albidus]|uniref:DUF7730 domain-containing protein n=1 Tax=Hymenoscyphus albidus TaxID=595503 RepID=A0A9N9LK27_9HELO|nr:hypothetical protein HYALB_00002140 [Hymenoscyphus albidus]
MASAKKSPKKASLVKKLPEFVSQANTKKGGTIPLASNTSALVPAKGIYSPEWYKNIAPNTGPLFEKLSLGLRLKLYEHVMNEIGTISGMPIEIQPCRNVDKFRDARSSIDKNRGPHRRYYEGVTRIGRDLSALYRICKQAYVEIHGEGLFYRQKTFHFTTTSIMMDYLAVLHPISRNKITSIHLSAAVYQNNYFAPNLVFSMLNSMESLRTVRFNLVAVYHHRDLDSLAQYVRKHKGLKNLKGIENFSFYIQNRSSQELYETTPEEKSQMQLLCKEIEDANAAKYAELVKASKGQSGQ